MKRCISIMLSLCLLMSVLLFPGLSEAEALSDSELLGSWFLVDYAYRPDDVDLGWPKDNEPYGILTLDESTFQLIITAPEAGGPLEYNGTWKRVHSYQIELKVSSQESIYLQTNYNILGKRVSPSSYHFYSGEMYLSSRNKDWSSNRHHYVFQRSMQREEDDTRFDDTDIEEMYAKSIWIKEGDNEITISYSLDQTVFNSNKIYYTSNDKHVAKLANNSLDKDTCTYTIPVKSTRTGDTLIYGDIPSNAKASGMTETYHAFTVIAMSEEEYASRMQQYEAEKAANNQSPDASASQSVFFGSYNQNGDSSEEIEWTVLDVDKEANKALLISKYGLDAVSYGTPMDVSEYSQGRYSWKKSYLREWLNNDFLTTAFSREERMYILDTEIQTNDAGGNDSSLDRIFCLSIEEAEKYFSDAVSMGCFVTETAKKKLRLDQGAVNEDGLGNWWLRNMVSVYTPAGQDSFMENKFNEAAFVSGTAGLSNAKAGRGSPIFCDYLITVRPAMWVDLAAIEDQLTQPSDETGTASTVTDRSNYKTLNYNDILRNPMSNWGVKYVIEGKVLQIFRSEEKGAPSGTWLCFRIATKGETDNVVICRIDNTFENALALMSIIEGDKVKVYCSCSGKKNFTTVLGAQVSLPIFNFNYDDIKVIEPKKD